jgi:carboxypeptidase Taq
LRPANDAEGCLQDVHWAIGSFGYFPSYVLGGCIAAQLYETLRRDHPDLDRDIEAGHFGSLFEGLRASVHGVGASLSAQQLIRSATGKALTAAPWLRYAEGKYLEKVTSD